MRFRIPLPTFPTLSLSESPVAAPSSLENKAGAIAILGEGIDMVFCNGRERFQALHSVHLEVPTGTVQMVMGPAGAGKTTLLLILAGLLTPTAGRIQVLGCDFASMTRSHLTHFRLQHIGLLFQESNLLRALTALENVEAALALKGIHGHEAREQARELLDAVHLSDRADYLPRQLSGGQQQRVAIARALAGKPEVIIADEPTAALDSHTGHVVITLLRQLAIEEGCTVLLATHDPRIVEFADRLLYLEDGVLRADDEPVHSTAEQPRVL